MMRWGVAAGCSLVAWQPSAAAVRWTRSSELSLASWRDPIGPCEDERAHTSYHGSVQDFSLDARV